MNRFINYQAIVLSVRNSGGANREAFFLTEEAGVIRATLYGGGKSSLLFIYSKIKIKNCQ